MKFNTLWPDSRPMCVPIFKLLLPWLQKIEILKSNSNLNEAIVFQLQNESQIVASGKINTEVSKFYITL